MKLFKKIFSPGVVFFFFLASILLPNIILSFTERMSIGGRLSNVLLPLGDYYLLMTLSRNLPRTILLMFPFAFFAAFQIVLLDLYGRSVIAVDMFLNLVTTNPGEVGELLGNMLPAILFVIVVYLPPIVWSIVCLVRKTGLLSEGWLHLNRRLGTLATTLGMFTIVTTMAADNRYHLRNDLYPANVLYNLGLAVERTADFRDYDANVADFRYDARSTRPDSLRQVYVLVIGETCRANNWSLFGYDRETTPRLSRRSGLTAFRDVLSESNTTHKSVPLMMTPLNAEEFDSLNYTKSVITAFKEAGFSTAAFSNQERNHSYIDRFLEEADTTLFIKEDPRFTAGGAPQDERLLDCLDGVLANRNTRQLIVLHTYGSHFNYADRYLPLFSFFRPTDNMEAVPSNRASLVNAYDNSIRSTDAFLDDVIARLDALPGVAASVIFTSDHGEDIYDDRRELFLHASPCPSIYQIYVPLLAWTSDTFRSLFPEKTEALRTNADRPVSSSNAVFHTLLDLAGIEAGRLDLRRSVASRSFTPHPRCYLNDHNEAVTLTDAGFLPEDFAEMKRLRLH